jgi:vanillate O-demethylase ferredoxin subunit
MRSAMITPPRKPGVAVEVYAIDRDAPHPYARSYAWFDPRSGEVLRFEPWAQSSAGNKAVRWMSALHTARAGVVPQIVLFLGILGVPVLAFTGARSYLRTRRATGEKP